MRCSSQGKMDRQKKGKKLVLGVGGGGVLPPSGLLLECAFRCQSPGGIRKLCRLPLIFYPQHAASLPLSTSRSLSVNREISAALVSVLQHHISPSQLKRFCEPLHLLQVYSWIKTITHNNTCKGLWVFFCFLSAVWLIEVIAWGITGGTHSMLILVHVEGFSLPCKVVKLIINK